MRALVALVLMVAQGCGKRGEPPQAGATAAPGDARPVPAPPPADAGPVPPAIGPSSYNLVDGALTVAVIVKLPPGWQDASSAEQLRFTTAAGTRLVIDLQGRTSDVADDARHVAHQQTIASSDGAHVLTCRAELSDSELARHDELAGWCASLAFERVPEEHEAWTIEVVPRTVTMAKRAVEVRIAVTNRSTQPIAPHRDPLEFLVDGQPSMALGLAFGNGGRGSEWGELGPGKTARDRRPGMELANAPGDHVIVIQHLGAELARTTLHVAR